MGISLDSFCFYLGQDGVEQAGPPSSGESKVMNLQLRLITETSVLQIEISLIRGLFIFQAREL